MNLWSIKSIVDRDQRDQMEQDLGLVSKKAAKLQSDLDSVQRMNEEGASKFFDDRNKLSLKSLQHVNPSSVILLCLYIDYLLASLLLLTYVNFIVLRNFEMFNNFLFYFSAWSSWLLFIVSCCESSPHWTSKTSTDFCLSFFIFFSFYYLLSL